MTCGTSFAPSRAGSTWGMNTRRRAEQATDQEVLAVVQPVRRVTNAAVRDVDRADEVVQETLARTLAVRHRLDPRALTPYALSVARNLVVSDHRERTMHDRHAPRLFEREEAPAVAGDLVERREEAAALSAALHGLSDDDRRLVCDKEIDRRDLAALAQELGSTPQALAARMARLRARLRVDYLLNLRRITLPTARCRAVLVTLSMGEGRRRRALSTKEHLDACGTCAELAEIVEARRRPLAGVLPIGFIAGGWAWLRDSAARRPWHVGACTATVAAVAVGAALVLHQEPQPRPAAAPQRPPATNVVTIAARVTSVPADEGFWIAQPGGRVWVQMTGSGESPQRIRPGQTVRFTGRRVAHGTGFARRVGLPQGPDATALDAQRSHLEVAKTQVRVG